MDTAAQGTSASLLQWFLSEHTLHGLTFLSLVLVCLGFLYLSYDLLAQPRGILRWLLIVFTHVGVSIVALLVVAAPLFFLLQEIRRAMHRPPNIVNPTDEIADIILFTLMIAVLQGMLIAFPHQSGTEKRFLWRNCLIGLIFALVFFSIDEYVIFHTPLNDVIDVIPDFLRFAFIGAVGAGLWQRYGLRIHSLDLSQIAEEEWQTFHVYEIIKRKEEPISHFFSFADFFKGRLFWSIILSLATMLWIVASTLLFGLTGEIWSFYLVDLFIGAAPASLICGSSQYITWKVRLLGEKQLGVVGVILTLFGFSLGFIEPLILFLTHP